MKYREIIEKSVSASISLVFFLVAATFLNVAIAEEKGLIVRAGYAAVDPNSNSETVPGAGGEVAADSGNALGLTVTYMLEENWGVGLLAASPFKHDIDHSVLGEVASTKHLPPTITLQYHFNTRDSGKPYVGIGMNYTKFFEEETSRPLEGVDLELDESFGLAMEAGVDWFIDEYWGASVQIWWLDIDTDASLDGGQEFEVRIDPLVYMFGLSYRL